MTTRLALISAHELLTWLDDEILASQSRIMKPARAEHPSQIEKRCWEKVQKRVRYMQVHGDAYREVFDCHQ